MNKKISKVILGLALVSMTITSIYIGTINKDSYEVIDIKGNRQELEDVNIVYQYREGLYKTTQVNISKDDIEIDNYAKEVPREFSPTSYIKEHRDLLKNAWNENSVYKDEESIGYVQIDTNYDNDSYASQKGKLIANIEDKNIKNNKIQSYEIPIQYDVINDANINYYNLNYKYVSIKYDGEIYIVLALDVEPSDVYEEDTNIHASKECLIRVYKLNLNSKTSKLIFNKKIGDKEDLSSFGGIAFSNDNIAYFIKESYEKSEENKVEKKFDLVMYNIKEKNFTTKEIDINSTNDNSLYRYYIEDDNVTFISEDYPKKNSVDIYMTTMNLSNNDIITNNEKYTIKTEDDKFTYSVNQVRAINGKLYLLVRAYGDNTDTSDKQYVYILDEKTKETLYVGIIKDENMFYTIPSILKEEEM